LRRDKHDIAKAVLKAARTPIQKTQLMYKARLSFAQLNRYLNLMMDNGLLENHRADEGQFNGTLYKTTKKGYRFIENLESAERLWKN
jgi:predicted transcriptional regulator